MKRELQGQYVTISTVGEKASGLCPSTATAEPVHQVDAEFAQ